MRWACAVLVVGAVGGARAQPVPDGVSPPPSDVCVPCERGRDHLASLESVRLVIEQETHTLRALAQLGIHGSTLTPEQDERLRDAPFTTDVRDALQQLVLRHGIEAMRDVSAMLCNTASSPCVSSLYGAMYCLQSNQCRVSDHDQLHFPEPERGCDPYVKRIRSPAIGFGAELAMGGQHSDNPVEGRAWGFGVEARRRFTRRFGVVGRFDRTKGRDAGRDTDGDGRDDVATGAVTRLFALAGPSIMLSDSRYYDIVRHVQLDLLGGYASTRSHAGEDGFVAGADLSYQLAVVRLGLRALQGVGDARDVRAALVHLGIQFGAGPQYAYGAGCGRTESPRGPALAFGLDVPLSGYSLGTGLGYLAPGIGIEAAYHLHMRFDALARGDVLVFPNGDGDRVLHQSLLAGGRFHLLAEESSSQRSAVFFTLMAGYAFAAVTQPSNAGSGPVIDASLGLGTQASDGGAWVRLHGRFGMTPDSADMRAVFLSAGIEIRVDRRRWYDDKPVAGGE